MCLWHRPFHRKAPTMTTSLAELSCFRFIGQCAQAGLFVAGLVTPCKNSTFQSPNLVHSTSRASPCSSATLESFFFAARLAIFGTHLTTSMFSCPHSIDDQPRPNNMFPIKTLFDARLSSALSAMSLGANSLKSSAT